MSIIEPKKVDGFTTESPIRAFTDFQVNGKYAIGKGFRPSMAHLAAYLDAMHTKEGWAFAQIILPRDSDGDPTILFWKSTYNPVMPELREAAPVERVVGMSPALGMGYSPECKPTGWEWTHEDSDAPIPDDHVEAALRFIGEQRALDTERFVKDFNRYFVLRKGNKQISHKALPEQIQFIIPGCPPAEIMRLLKAFRAKSKPDIYGIANIYAGDKLVEGPIETAAGTITHFGHTDLRNREKPTVIPPMTSSVLAHVGEGPIPELVYWNGEAGNFYGMESRRGQGQEFMDTWYPRRAEFPTSPADEDPDNPDQRPAVERLIDEAEAPSDDPLNPKHYHGRECADIGEILTANSYQVLKYNWRLGEKDSPCVELGKALWYLDSEIALGAVSRLPLPEYLPEHPWFDEKLRRASDHAKAVARILISWNRYGNIHSLRGLRKLLQTKLDQLNGCPDWGRGLEP